MPIKRVFKQGKMMRGELAKQCSPIVAKRPRVVRHVVPIRSNETDIEDSDVPRRKAVRDTEDVDNYIPEPDDDEDSNKESHLASSGKHMSAKDRHICYAIDYLDRLRRKLNTAEFSEDYTYDDCMRQINEIKSYLDGALQL